MKFTLLVLGAPHSSQAPHSALQFATSAIAGGHAVQRVFFYNDGVHNGSAIHTTPQGEFDLTGAWQAFSQEHGVPLIACIASALRRGVVSQEEATRHEHPSSNLNEPTYSLNGLGELATAITDSDRIITFGGNL